MIEDEVWFDVDEPSNKVRVLIWDNGSVAYFHVDTGKRLIAPETQFKAMFRREANVDGLYAVVRRDFEAETLAHYAYSHTEALELRNKLEDGTADWRIFKQV